MSTNPLVFSIMVSEQLVATDDDTERDGYEFTISLIANNRDHEAECGVQALVALRDELNKLIEHYVDEISTNDRDQYVTFLRDMKNAKVTTDVFTTKNPITLTLGVLTGKELAAALS